MKTNKSELNRIRALDACCVLEDAITIASIYDYPKIKEIRTALEYIMQKAGITNEELTTYQMNKT